MTQVAYPTGADPSQLYAWAQRLALDLNRDEGSRTDTLRAVTTSTDVSGADYFIAANAAAGPITVTLPPLTVGRQVIVKKVDASTNTVTLTGGTIDGGSSFIITAPQQSVSIIGAANGWLII